MASDGSSAEVGSSHSKTRGDGASARAMATRCCWPPDSVTGQASALAVMPTFSSSSMARARARGLSQRCTVTRPSMTLSITLWWGNSWKFWNTIPVWRRMRCTASRAGRRPSNASVSGPSRSTPASGISSRFTQRSSVLLPLPEGPIRAVTLPSGMTTSTPCNTRLPPKLLSMPCSPIIDVAPRRRRAGRSVFPGAPAARTGPN
ncbi:Protein of uncharacterised function (DUF1602) [Bordetella pertussis]|nr:Protein of uncharacterised function (DUF1602) [Bordetella pertussis]